MSSTEVIILVLGVLVIGIGGVGLANWINSRTSILAMAQLQEGYRQAICGADEIGNKLMAMLDARTHAYYRQAANVQGKPPAVRSHAAPTGPFAPPPPRVTGTGAGVVDPDSIAEAQRRVRDLEELAARNGEMIAGPADYGAKEPD